MSAQKKPIVVRSNNKSVQQLCALLALGPEIALSPHNRAADLIAAISKRLEDPEASWPVDQSADVKDYWFFVAPVMPYDLKGEYRGTNALFFAQSSDTAALFKAIANVAIWSDMAAMGASKAWPLGAPARLLTYGFFIDSEISKLNATLDEVASRADTFVFRLLPEGDRKVVPSVEVDVWYPVVLHASLALGGESDPDKLAAFLQAKWRDTHWSPSMIQACAKRLPAPK